MVSERPLTPSRQVARSSLHRAALRSQSGAITRDATGGYGPEEFALKVAKPGKYRVEADFYGHRQQVLTSSTGLDVEPSRPDHDSDGFASLPRGAVFGASPVALSGAASALAARGAGACAVSCGATGSILFSRM